MQILLASAKIMTGVPPDGISGHSQPEFEQQALEQALHMSAYDIETLMQVLRCNRDIAAENWKRYQHFIDASTRQPAVFCYDGMVFQKLAPETFSPSELAYTQQHLFIGSFLYGLLRPLDLVNRYRLEGDVVLPENGVTMFDYWKPILTDWFIHQVKADDGVLLNLASAEFKKLFDWKRVSKELTIVTPDFKIFKDGALKNVTIYAKMCRGAMAQWVLKERVTQVEQLKTFNYEGFSYDSSHKFITFVH